MHPKTLSRENIQPVAACRASPRRDTGAFSVSLQLAQDADEVRTREKPKHHGPSRPSSARGGRHNTRPQEKLRGASATVGSVREEEVACEDAPAKVGERMCRVSHSHDHGAARALDSE